MLGSDLVRYLSDRFSVTGINKENYSKYIGHSFDILINANGNSKRFWANQHPLEDFNLSTESVYHSVFDFPTDLYIYISSIDVYVKHNSVKNTDEKTIIDPQKLEPYGLHKYLSEMIIRRYAKNYLLLRSSLMLGRTLKKGPFFDIKMQQPLYISSSSRLKIITTKEIAQIVIKLIGKNIKNETFNMGGVSTFSFKRANKYFEKKISYRPDAKEQIYEMNVSKLKIIFSLKSSNFYVKDYLQGLS